MAKELNDRRQHRRRGHTRISRQHQVTLPVDAMKAAGLQEGDRLKASSPAPGIVILERETDPLDALRGDMTGTYQPGDLDSLRDEWD
jgi:bifunctional DNA-binding transcriptional regulator/antitoxin component of YhaV-PrlF toxin-antitoxin module